MNSLHNMSVELTFEKYDQLTTNEINLLCFTSAFLLAICVILFYHARYRKVWQVHILKSQL